MSRKGQSITLSISDHDKAQLEVIAQELGMMWGSRANISKLVEAIARRQLIIAPNNNWSDTRIKALERSIRTLTDTGQVEEAQVIASLLLERSELSLPLRKEIERFLENLPPPWRLEINRYILRQQPFQLSYRDATDRLWLFTVRHAQINFHERGQYLDCWCDETTGNLDLPDLVHNWSLRLDRITEAAVAPIEGQWHSQLSQMEVEMYLLGRLAFAYKAKSGDVSIEWLPDRERVRRVVRRITSTYWFLREILQYGEDCVIVSPESVRSRLIDKLKSLCQRYQLSVQDQPPADPPR